MGFSVRGNRGIRQQVPKRWVVKSGVERSGESTVDALVGAVGAGSTSAEASVGETGFAFGLLDLALDDLALVVGHLQHRERD